MIARRGLSRILVTVAVLAGSLAWMGFTLQRTVFDPARSERVIRVLLDDPSIRNVLLQRVANSIDAALPSELRSQIPLDQLAAVSAATLEDPAVRTAIERALVGTQQYLIGERETRPSIDTALIDATARQKIAAVRPDLAAFVPQLPPIEVGLPAEGLSPLRRVNDLTTAVTPLLALVALCAAAGAVSISPHRPRTLRRLGWWAVGAGVSWVVLRFALPAVAGVVLPSSAAVAAALAEAVSGSMAGPGLAMVLAGSGLVLGGYVIGLLPSPADRRAQAPRPVPQRRRADRAVAATQPATPPTARPTPAGGAGRAANGSAPATAAPAARASHSSTVAPEDPTTYSPGGAVRGAAVINGGTPTTPTPAGDAAGVTPAPSHATTDPTVSMSPPIAPSPAFSRPPETPLVSIPLPRRNRPAPDADLGGGGTELAGAGGSPRTRTTPRPAPNEWLGGFSMDPDDHERVADAAPPPPRWVEGVGYVYDYAPGPGARWIDGLGYVLDA